MNDARQLTTFVAIDTLCALASKVYHKALVRVTYPQSTCNLNVANDKTSVVRLFQCCTAQMHTCTFYDTREGRRKHVEAH